MTTATKQSPRERMLAFAAAWGWQLDPNALRYVWRYNNPNSHDQDPHVWVKDTEGGQWRVKFDYNKKSGYISSYSPYGDLLHSLTLWYVPADAEVEVKELEDADGTTKTVSVPKGRYIGRLYRKTYYGEKSRLFDVTGRDMEGETFYTKGGEPRSLPKRIEIFLKNPELAVWLSAEAHFEDDEAAEKAAEEARLDRKLRKRPLPVKVSTGDDYQDGEWQDLARELVQAAQRVDKADGKSDLYALIADVHVALRHVMHATEDLDALALAMAKADLADLGQEVDS